MAVAAMDDARVRRARLAKVYCCKLEYLQAYIWYLRAYDNE